MPRMIPLQLGKILYTLTNGLTGKELRQAVAQFATLLKKEQMTSKLSYIIEAFEKIAQKEEGITSLTITTAQPISKELLTEIEAQFGNVAETKTVTDDSLIGGVVVRTGNTILDGSVKTQLAELKRSTQ